MPAKINLDFDKLYNSINPAYGKYKIIEDLGIENRHRYANIKFINTNNICKYRLDAILSGKVKDDMAGINFDKIYNHPRYGNYKIIEYLGRDEKSNRLVKIKFLDYENEEKITLFRLADSCQVKPDFIKIGKEFMSCNYGPFVIKEIYSGYTDNGKKIDRKALVHFIETGYEAIYTTEDILSGCVRDKYATSIYNIDTTILQNPDAFILKCLKYTWNSMMTRCYKSNAPAYNEVTVCSRWHNMNTFIEDAKYLPQFYKYYRFPNNYRIDKDYLQLSIPNNKRIYSPETCMFLSTMDNSNLRAIENKRNHPEKFSSKYYNVSKRNGNYVVAMFNIYLGSYTDEIVAASVANYWQLYFHRFDIIPLLNNVPNMTPDQFIHYRVNPKELCIIKE